MSLNYTEVEFVKKGQKVGAIGTNSAGATELVLDKDLLEQLRLPETNKNKKKKVSITDATVTDTD